MKYARAAGLLPLVVALAACGNEPGSSDRTGDVGGAEAMSDEARMADHADRGGDLPADAACALLTAADIGAVFGEPVGDGQPREDPLGGVTCKWTNAAGDLEVDIVRRVRRRPEAIMDAARASWAIDGVVDLDGIGDDAFYNADPGGLPGSEVVIRSGNENHPRQASPSRTAAHHRRAGPLLRGDRWGDRRASLNGRGVHPARCSTQR